MQGVSEELLLDINREATRRMTALVAPQASEAHGPPMLRLSMGQLFEEVCHCRQKGHPAGSCLRWHATSLLSEVSECGFSPIWYCAYAWQSLCTPDGSPSHEHCLLTVNTAGLSQSP